MLRSLPPLRLALVLTLASILAGLFGGNEPALAAGDYWSDKAPMTAARNNHASAVVDGLIYVIGGNGFSAAASVERYDPVSNTWSTRASLPTPRASLAAAAVSGKIYAIGGDTPGTVEEYDPQTNQWTAKANMPTPRGGLNAVALDGKIYAIGGGAPLAVVEVYDPLLNTWASRASMPTARYFASASVIAGKIYVVGGCAISCGYDGTGALATVEEYSPVTNTWATKTSMPTARWALGSAGIGKSLFAVGGLANNGVHLNTLEEYMPANDSWVSRSPMPYQSQGHTTESVAYKLYSLGGHPQAGGFWLPNTAEYTPLDSDDDLVSDSADNCLSTPNLDQANTDGDGLGDACDGDDDNDGVADATETPCGSDPLDITPPLSRPERLDGPFAGVDDDGDTAVDEALPGGASGFDCDGDGYKGSAEDHVFSYLPQTNGDQKTCQEYDTSFPNPTHKPSKRWPADLNGSAFSLNKINVQDLAGFINPIRYLNQDVGTDPMDVRFDLVPGSTVGFDINVADMAALTTSASGFPSMLGGARAFGGPVCPWPP